MAEVPLSVPSPLPAQQTLGDWGHHKGDWGLEDRLLKKTLKEAGWLGAVPWDKEAELENLGIF